MDRIPAPVERRRLERRAFVLIGLVVAAAAAFGIGIGLAHVLTSSRTPTEQTSWTAPAAVESGAALRGLPAASCSAPSRVLPGVAATWTCRTGERTLDPCFGASGPATTQVACAEAPWSPVTRLRLVRRLPDRASAGSGGTVWALQLSSGEQCVLNAAPGVAVPGVAGETLAYACGTDGWAGQLTTAGPDWTAVYLARGSGSAVRASVARAWRVG